MKLRLGLAVLLAGAGFRMSQDRFDYKGRTYFFAGFAGDAAALDKGMKICEDTLATEPKNAEALVWHGSGLTYQGSQGRPADRHAIVAAWLEGNGRRGCDRSG